VELGEVAILGVGGSGVAIARAAILLVGQTTNWATEGA
jgi:hypothetical protein